MNTKQYICRSVGCLIKLAVLFALLYLLMCFTGTARVSGQAFIDELFGTPRGVMLLVALVVYAAFFPLLGYVSRRVEGMDIEADRDAVIAAMHSANYILTVEKQGESMSFRAGSGLRRLWLAFDDKVVVRAAENGVTIEGPRKEAVHAQFRMNTYVQYRKNEGNN